MTRLTLEIDGTTVSVSPSQSIVIGRDAACQARVTHELVSRRHLEVSFAGGQWTARDLGTLNGTYLDGLRLAANVPARLQSGTTVLLGDPATGARVRVLAVGGPEAPHPHAALGSRLPLSPSTHVAPDSSRAGRDSLGFTASAGPVTIGRAPDNTIVIHDPMVSAHHTRISPRATGTYLVEDLRSTNGTFVDGVRVDTCELRTGSVLSLGKVFWRATPSGLVQIAQAQTSTDGPGEVALSVSRVTFTVPTTRRERESGAGPVKTLLDGVTVNVPPRSLVAVIGPSGAGKSTMLKTMTGALKPDQGQVLFNGLDMSVFASSIADRVGMVPQDDLLHDDLTARQALGYAARLRFPDDTSAEERAAAVEWTLRELGLTDHADRRIRQLSGGQRKRVSTAMELLTKPDLLFLDEPTSGLDPNLDREVMELLRALAHGTPNSPDGRTVVVITHSTDNLDKADLVLLLAPGGKVAYFGPPGELREFFTPHLAEDFSYSGMYNLIAAHPEQARAEFASSRLAPRPASIVSQKGSPNETNSRMRRRRLLPQTLTLLGRQARLMISDRSLLMFTIALPIVVGLLTLAVQAEDGFNAATVSKAVGEPRILLVVLVFGAVLMGMVPSVRQLVGERAIFVREASVGVRPSAYLASKVALLGVVCALQSALMVTVALSLNPHPARGVAGPLGWELFVVALGTSWACSVMGLLLSGLVTTSDQVMPLMVLVLMFQLVMCGGVLDVTAPGITQASLISPSRWGYAAGASSLDFNRNITCNSQILVKAKEDEEVNRKAKEATDDANQRAADKATKNGMPAPTPEKAKVQNTVVDCATVDGQDRLWEPTGVRWFGNLLGLALWFAAYAGGTYFALRRVARK